MVVDQLHHLPAPPFLVSALRSRHGGWAGKPAPPPPPLRRSCGPESFPRHPLTRPRALGVRSGVLLRRAWDQPRGARTQPVQPPGHAATTALRSRALHRAPRSGPAWSLGAPNIHRWLVHAVQRDLRRLTGASSTPCMTRTPAQTRVIGPDPGNLLPLLLVHCQVVTCTRGSDAEPRTLPSWKSPHPCLGPQAPRGSERARAWRGRAAALNPKPLNPKTPKP